MDLSTELISPLLAYSLSGIFFVLTAVALLCLPYARIQSPLLSAVLLLATGAFNCFALMLHAIDTSNDASLMVSLLAMFGMIAWVCTPYFWRFLINVVWFSFRDYHARYNVQGSKVTSLTEAYYLFKPYVLVGAAFASLAIAALLGCIICPLLWLSYVLCIYSASMKRMYYCFFVSEPLTRAEIEAKYPEASNQELAYVEMYHEAKRERLAQADAKPVPSVFCCVVLFIGVFSTIGSLINVQYMTVSTFVAKPMLEQAYQFEIDTAKSAAEKKAEQIAKGEPVTEETPSVPVPTLTLNNGALRKSYDTRTVFGCVGNLSDICNRSDECSNLQFYIIPVAEEGASICTWQIASCNTKNGGMETYLNGKKLTSDAVKLNSGDTVALKNDGEDVCAFTVSIQ